MLEDRARLLLKALIERYTADGQPVGSRTLARTCGLELSPATIRGVMADLEEMGLIASPHTSAGRVPTARGWRLFVDTMLTVERADMADMHMAAAPAAQLGGGPPQQVLADAASLLSSLSQFVGVVRVPRRSSVFRHIEFVRLSARRFLLIIVSPDGDVQNRVIVTDVDYSEAQLLQASNFLNSHYAGLDMQEVRTRLQGEVERLRGEVAALMQAAVQVGSETLARAQEDVVIAGERNLLAVSDFAADMHNLRRAFDLFEQKTQILRLLDFSRQAQGVRIYIGGKPGDATPGAAWADVPDVPDLPDLSDLSDLSIVSAPYTLDGEIVGTLGVIGPTRMPYERMVQIVDITARLLGNALSHKA